MSTKEHLFYGLAHVCSGAEFNKAYFCLSVIVGLFQNSLESSFSMSSLFVHIHILGVCMAIGSKLFILSYFLICFSKNLMGPLSGVSIMESHSSFW